MRRRRLQKRAEKAVKDTNSFFWGLGKGRRKENDSDNEEETNGNNGVTHNDSGHIREPRSYSWAGAGRSSTDLRHRERNDDEMQYRLVSVDVSMMPRLLNRNGWIPLTVGHEGIDS